MSLLNKVIQEQYAENIKFKDASLMNTKRFVGKVNLVETINARMEDFVHLVFYRNQMYLLGFVGYTCIARKFPVDIQGDTEPFEISLNREVLKILSNKEGLTIELKDGQVILTFKYGEGLMRRVLKPTAWREDTKRYLEFIINSDRGKSEGKVNSGDLKNMNKILRGVIPDEKSRNIVIGDGYLYAITPTFVLYKSGNVNTDMLITETLLSNLPRKNQMFECRTYNGFQGLVGLESPIYYIFKGMNTESDITPYTDLKIEWTAKLPKGVENPINVVCFGENKPLDFIFKSNTVSIIDTISTDNVFVGVTEVFIERTEELNSIIRNFKGMDLVGRVKTNKAPLKALKFNGGEICLLG